MDALTATIDALAVTRLSRLIGRDTLPPVRRAREWWLSKHPEVGDEAPDGGTFIIDLEAAKTPEGLDTDADGHGTWRSPDGREFRAYRAMGQITFTETDPLGELVVCPWCHSIYLAFGVLAARRVVPRVWGPVAWVLAASEVCGMLASREE